MSTPDTRTPDAAAAALTWRGQPLPQIGSTVRVTHTSATERGTRTTTDTVRVATVSLSGDTLTINNQMTLSADRLTDKWAPLLSAASNEAPAPLVAAPAPTPADAAARQTALTGNGPDPNPATMAGMLRRFEWCKQRAAVAEADAKALKAERDRLETEIADRCVEEGLDAPPVVDGRTYSFTPVRWVEYLVNDDGQKYTTGDVIRALRACGLDVGLVSLAYNGNSLKATLSEMKDRGEELPDALAAVIKLEERSGLRSVAASKSKKRGAAALRAVTDQG